MNYGAKHHIIMKGCPSKREASMVKQIYLELCEVKRYWDVEYFYHEVHQKTYIRAKVSKTQKPSLFIPNHVSDSTNFQQMKYLLSLNSDEEYQSIFLALISPDSTCIYYQISNGLVTPKEITSKHLVRNNQKECDILLKKHRNLLEQSALYGIPITLNVDNEDREKASCSKVKT